MVKKTGKEKKGDFKAAERRKLEASRLQVAKLRSRQSSTSRLSATSISPPTKPSCPKDAKKDNVSKVTAVFRKVETSQEKSSRSKSITPVKTPLNSFRIAKRTSPRKSLEKNHVHKNEKSRQATPICCIDVDEELREEEHTLLGKRKELSPIRSGLRIDTHSPLKPILKTSPMYSPIKTSGQKRNIQIREEYNLMKNFYKDTKVASPPSKVAHEPEVDAQEILNTTLNMTVDSISRRLRQSPNKKTSTTPEEKIKDNLLRSVSFSVKRPSYIGKPVQREKVENSLLEGISPVRFVEKIGPRYFADSFQSNSDVEIDDMIHIEPFPSTITEPKGGIVRRSPMKTLVTGKLEQNNFLLNQEIPEQKPNQDKKQSLLRSSSPQQQILQNSEPLFMPETVDWPRDCPYEGIKTSLRSREEEQVKANSKFLLEIAKSFSLSFDLSLPEVVASMLQVEGPYINLGAVRKQLLRRAFTGC